MSEQDNAARANEQSDAARASDDNAARATHDAARANEQGPAEDHQASFTDAENSTGDEQGDTKSLDYWKEEADKWKRAAQKAEKVNKGEAGRLNKELDQLREAVANHDSESVEAAGALATERLHTKLARAGVSEQDAGALLEHIDPLRLLNDGAPSSKAIDNVASSLARSLGRSGVDDDQGKRSDGNTFSADDWIRRKANKK